MLLERAASVWVSVMRFHSSNVFIAIAIAITTAFFLRVTLKFVNAHLRDLRMHNCESQMRNVSILGANDSVRVLHLLNTYDFDVNASQVLACTGSSASAVCLRPGEVVGDVHPPVGAGPSCSWKELLLCGFLLCAFILATFLLRSRSQ